MIDDAPNEFGLQKSNALIKRAFDFVVSGTGLFLTWPLLIVLALAARWTTGASGVYKQRRIGLFGNSFTLYKLRSMKIIDNVTTHVTTTNDQRITAFGRFLRKTKLDELPQLWNVFKGDMSFVGPRPDVEELYQGMTRNDLRILSVRPGITGPASLAFRREEELLKNVENPEHHNKTVIFPQKIHLNLQYLDNQSLIGDVQYILKTIF